jgi:hypothetical protein
MVKSGSLNRIIMYLYFLVDLTYGFLHLKESRCRVFFLELLVRRALLSKTFLNCAVFLKELSSSVYVQVHTWNS